MGKSITTQKKKDQQTMKDQISENEKRNEKDKKTLETLKIGCWNIRRGLVKREEELKEMLRREKIDIMFLVETDTEMIREEKDYKIEGFRTTLPKRRETENKIRIIGLISEGLGERTKEREDLTSQDFPSIWLEVERKGKKR